MRQPNRFAKHIWERYGLCENPPVHCQFKVGDMVIFTNQAGIEFDMDIVGFSQNTEFYGRFIHTIRHNTDGSGSAWWFPQAPSELRLVV